MIGKKPVIIKYGKNYILQMIEIHHRPLMNLMYIRQSQIDDRDYLKEFICFTTK